MITRAELLARRLRELMVDVTEVEWEAISKAEEIIDNQIKLHINKKSHWIPFYDGFLDTFRGVSQEITEERARELLHVLICKYENGGWRISLDNDSLILDS